MSVPAALKSVPALTSFGVLGTGAVGVGGWQLIEGVVYANSAMYMPFHSGNVPKLSDFGMTKNTYEANDWKKSYDCFSEFFKDVSVIHNKPSKAETTSFDANKLRIDPPSDKGKGESCGVLYVSTFAKVG